MLPDRPPQATFSCDSSDDNANPRLSEDAGDFGQIRLPENEATILMTEHVPASLHFSNMSYTSPGTRNVSLPQQRHQSAWGNRPSESTPAPSSPRRSALTPPENSTAHQVWVKNKSSTTQPAASSSTSANPPSGSEKTSPAKPNMLRNQVPLRPPLMPRKERTLLLRPPTAGKFNFPTIVAPSSLSLSSAVSLASESVSGSVQIDPSKHDNDYDYDYDEKLTEETYHENWETASVYVPNENDTVAVRIGSNDKGKGKSVSPVTTSKAKTATANLWPKDNPQPSSSLMPVNLLWANPVPAKQEPVINLWADLGPNLQPTIISLVLSRSLIPRRM
ncbi:hypothetical protein M378DRAFT_12034 [Amanita muscaria Koide BX008]|uniref:Uncharacterized protein n=1 Tax=Amanita muscaria (strain Koide BX008) TaxID=946122 RepID=A0A0C2SK75_AMAMK|nr:hypothetical protein M378DRAFT_12034 [Amanita muscaria Koide BX008]